MEGEEAGAEEGDSSGGTALDMSGGEAPEDLEMRRELPLHLERRREEIWREMREVEVEGVVVAVEGSGAAVASVAV